MGGKQSRSLKLRDFVLRWGRPRRQSAEEQLSIFRALAARQNARSKQ